MTSRRPVAVVSTPWDTVSRRARSSFCTTVILSGRQLKEVHAATSKTGHTHAAAGPTNRRPLFDARCVSNWTSHPLSDHPRLRRQGLTARFDSLLPSKASAVSAGTTVAPSWMMAAAETPSR